MKLGLPRSLVIVLGALLWWRPDPSFAHELQVDELQLWLPPGTSELRGQLTFDPELTRRLEDSIDEEVVRRRIVSFVRTQLNVRPDDVVCPLEPTVREVYKRGGAAPGDVVVFSCNWSSPDPSVTRPTTLTVTLGDALPALLIRVSGMVNNEREEAVVATRGSISVFHDSNLLLPHPSPPKPTPGSKQPATSLARLLAFVVEGACHVLPSGIDHLLFVVATALGARRRWSDVLVLLGTFTVAHTASVAWIALGFATPPSRAVETLIAASIAMAGFGAYLTSRTVGSSAGRFHALSIVFLFGVIHGLGFAGGLTRFGVGESGLLAAIVGFNLGVELAQLSVALPLLALLRWLERGRRGTTTERWVRLTTLGAGLVGIAWTILRLLGR